MDVVLITILFKISLYGLDVVLITILFKISLYGLDGVLIAEVQILPTGESFIDPHTVR